MKDKISNQKIKKYFSITKKALDLAKEKGFDQSRKDLAREFYDMAYSYYSDANYFFF